MVAKALGRVVVVVAGLAVAWGCDDNGDGVRDECITNDVVACAESLVVPDSGSTGVAFSVMLGGTVGPTLCYKFVETEARWKSLEHLELRPRGELTICEGVTCPPAFREFSDVVMIEPRTAGWLRIEVISDCTSIVDSVAVRAVLE
jgi:hypothetical protein